MRYNLHLILPLREFLQNRAQILSCSIVSSTQSASHNFYILARSSPLRRADMSTILFIGWLLEIVCAFDVWCYMLCSLFCASCQIATISNVKEVLSCCAITALKRSSQAALLFCQFRGGFFLQKGHLTLFRHLVFSRVRIAKKKLQTVLSVSVESFWSPQNEEK